GDPELDLGFLDLLGDGRHLRKIRLATRAEQAHVLQLERLQASFRFPQLAFVILDLVVDELACAVSTDASSAEALLDERGQRGLDHITSLAAVGITERDGVEVICALAVDVERSSCVATCPARAQEAAQLIPAWLRPP